MLKILKCSADKRWPASVGCIVATVLCVSATVAVAQEDCPESDLLLIDANIYTGGDDNTSHEALAIKDGMFSFIGSNDAASRWVCGARQVVSLDGSTVFPGFTDSHQHLEGIGRRTKTLSLFGTNTLEQTVTEIEGWAAQIPAGQWVLDRGWIEREWVGERRFLTRWDVDPFTESKPLFMPRADGVSALVNSKALILAGITRETPDPAGGRFDRNNEGELTGYVLGNAMEPFRNLIPADTDAYVKDNLRRGMAVNASRGWTSTHDAGMSWRELRLLQELRYEGAMAHRVYVAVPIAQAGPLLEQGAEQSDDGLIDLGGVKVFIDGTLGSRGAALLEPYTDANHNGFMNRTTKAELMPVLEGALRNGLQILTHVIGDRAVSVTLDWYQEAWDALPRGDWQREDLRWRLEHAQIIPIEDQQRLHDMNVIASMQPSHAIGDLNFAPARLGLERLQVAYPWRPLLERGVKIVGGSDAPVEAGDPRIEFYAAITRQRLDGTSGAGWHPEHAVAREDALRMFTLWPAYSVFQEERRGSISVGKQADLSIFDTDFLRAKPAAILTAKTVMTVVNGRIAYIADRSTDTPD
ncbi:amidohydrolase [Luminiphilus sp.]|nr:amidohydrolase [Luminiphilus sp.]